ncbi:MAG: ribonuclease M5 [Erysipelotrichaceae bacterium]|jgi:ribonuclease M5
MIKIKEMIVVEGKHDKEKLERLFDCQVLCTNGLAITKEDLEIIKTASENNGVIILTDPDFPGKKIRDIIDSEINNVKHVFVDKDKAVGKRNVGIEYVSDDDLIEALEKTVTFTTDKESISWSEYLKLDLIKNKTKRDYLSKQLNLGSNNNKKLFKYLNMLGYEFDYLKGILDKYGWQQIKN